MPATDNPEILNKSKHESPTVSKMSDKETKKRLSKFFFDPNVPVTWLGIDFSQVRILEKGGAEKNEADEKNEKISTVSFKEWNDLVLAEKKRYDIGGALRHDKITYSNNYVNTKNDTIKIDRLFITDKNQLNYLSPAILQSDINTYHLDSKEGYGLVFIVESLDNQRKETNTWVTLIDMKSGQVLIAEKMRANAGGVGLRNFWARGFHNTINDVKERKYPEWKLQHKK
jgi:hypothetical protein